MDSTEREIAVPMAAELNARMPFDPAQHCDLVFENDLAGRAALAVLWQHRQHLTIQLVTDDPTDRNVLALQAGLESVRNAPDIHLLSPDDAAGLSTTSSGLIWAVSGERTSPVMRDTLQDRNPETTFTPYFRPFAALESQAPNQRNPAHELILRDIIADHARFLNFYGDRFNPQDLYERSKYPSWLTPSTGFIAAIPPLRYTIETADGTPLSSHAFTGVLQLDAADILAGQRAHIDFGLLAESLETTFDITVDIYKDYANPTAAGALEIQVQQDQQTIGAFDLATSAAQLHVPIAGLTPGSALSVGVVALRDNPKPSWSKASQTQVHIRLHPKGTHPVPNVPNRINAWLQRVAQRRRRGRTP